MLMKEHLPEIDHIIHDLKQIENTEFDTNRDMNPLEHSKIIAEEAIEEFIALLEHMETDEFNHSGVLYDSLMIRKMCMVSYYMSRFEFDNLFRTNLTFEETCEECARMIACNPESIIQMKNLYDNYFSKKEIGREQEVHISDDMRMVINECIGLTDEEMAIACKMELRKKSMLH
jgi:chlorite dismutase